MRIRVILALVLVLVAPLASSSPAAAQEYGGGTLTIDDASLEPGQQFRLFGTGWEPNSTVVVYLDGEQLGTVVADGEGNFTFVGTLPLGTEPGQHTLSAVSGDLEQSLVITVGPADAAGTLPRTGTESGSLARVAGALLLIGFGAVLLARRHRAVALRR
jgi:LPXTG-motif cell wall-anchored protein